MAEQINFRASSEFRRRLEQLAEANGTSIAGTIKAAVMGQSPSDRGVPDEQEVLELLGQAARGGSVSAMKELRGYHRQQREGTQEDEGAIDELAGRRAKRAS